MNEGISIIIIILQPLLISFFKQVIIIIITYLKCTCFLSGWGQGQFCIQQNYCISYNFESFFSLNFQSTLGPLLQNSKTVAFHFAANDPASLKALYRVMASQGIKFVSMPILPFYMAMNQPKLNCFFFFCKKHEFFSFIASCFKMLSEDGSKLHCDQCCAGSLVTFREVLLFPRPILPESDSQKHEVANLPIVQHINRLGARRGKMGMEWDLQ